MVDIINTGTKKIQDNKTSRQEDDKIITFQSKTNLVNYNTQNSQQMIKQP